MHLKHLLPTAATFILAAALTSQTSTPQADPAHPTQTRNWVDTKLYFGLGPAGMPSKGVSEAAWRRFLDTEVTPRFPAGLSVADVYGQWQGMAATGAAPQPVSRIRSKMLIIDYSDTSENNSRIEAIRSAWKRQTGDLSVLKVTQAADISF